MNTTTDQAKKDFNEFLEIMDEQLDWLRDQAEDNGISLSDDISDCEKLERLFVVLAEKMDKEMQSSLVVTFARHLGELVRLNFGGQWRVHLKQDKSPHLNLPVLVGHSPIADLEFAPTLVMRAFALRRKPGSLRLAIESQVKPRPLDLSHLIES